MRKRIILFNVIGLLAVCGAAPAQACGFPCGWGFAAPPYRACFPLGFFFFGSHLGLGPGYPGLHGYHPYSCARIIPCPSPAGTTLKLVPNWKIRFNAKGSERKVVQGEVGRTDSSGTQGSAKYSSIVERARKLYPNGLPPIESVWNPYGTVQKMNNR